MIKRYIAILPCQVINNEFAGDCSQADNIVDGLIMTAGAADARGQHYLNDNGYNYISFTASGADIENYLPGRMVAFNDPHGGLIKCRIKSVSTTDDFVAGSTTATLTLERLQ